MNTHILPNKKKGGNWDMGSSQISVQAIGFCRFDASQTTFYGLPYRKANKVPLNGIEDLRTPDFRNAISH
ncbi:hypothetical protein GCM10017784_33840 [Deinococcus indicus]|nr:hypothetical protein GCM10017784_33840 [Deinococcus indicus]